MRILIPEYLKEEITKGMESPLKDIDIDYYRVTKKGRIFPFKGYNLFINGARFKESVKNVEVLIAPYYCKKPMMSFLLSRLPDLRWIHSTKSGVEDLLVKSIEERDITVTNSHLSSEAVSEFVLTMMLSISRNLLSHLRMQKQGVWKFVPSGQIKWKKVGIMGLGKVGRAIAKRLKENGMTIWGLDRIYCDNPEIVDNFVASEDIDSLLSNCDFIVIALPLSSETRYLINEEKLGLIKKDAWLINVARGEIVDGKALYKSLLNNKIAGACLDVLDNSLLGKIKQLGKLDNVLLTHHSCFSYPDYNKDVIKLFVMELNNFINKKSFKNVVNIYDGY